MMMRPCSTGSEPNSPPHVYDVPHFDFHFYLVSHAAQMKVVFKDEKDFRRSEPTATG